MDTQARKNELQKWAFNEYQRAYRQYVIGLFLIVGFIISLFALMVCLTIFIKS